MQEAFRAAREANYDRVWLGVMSENAPTITWYRSLGFAFVEEAPFTMGRTTVRHLIGFKLLTPTDPPPDRPLDRNVDRKAGL